jgi:hypothetical protein
LIEPLTQALVGFGSPIPMLPLPAKYSALLQLPAPNAAR